jgi:hypothetical protein
MAKDIAQRELDQGGFRISNLGAPTAAGDATRTDNITVPSANAGSGSPGASFLAAPADHVHPAAQGAAAGVLLTFSDPSEQSAAGPNETVVAEFLVDFPSLSRNDMQVGFGAVVNVDGGTATFNVRLVPDPGVVEGVILAAITTTSGAFELKATTGARFAPVSGPALLQVTAANDNAAVTCRIKSKTVVLKSA